MTLVDDVADLLAVHNEVDAVSGECQEGVVDMMQLVDNHTVTEKLSTLAHTHKAMDAHTVTET